MFNENFKLGFGLMRLPLTDPADAKSVDKELLKQMVDEFIAAGGTYFDTAWMYHDFTSESVVKEVLVDRYPRESFTLTTKMQAMFFNSKEEREKIFEKQLEKTGAGYFDYYLLHALDHEIYARNEKFDSFSWIMDKKEKGLAKHIGFSYHDDAELLDKILTDHPEFEFVQLQLNYLDWESNSIQSRLCCEVCEKHGKPIIVMEPVKGGTLTGLKKEASDVLKNMHPEWSEASWALRFAMSQKNVELVLSGMSDMDQMKDNLKTALDFKPLNDEENNAVRAVVNILNGTPGIPCTGCSYCTPGCPMSIPIPKCFALYNADVQEVEGKGWTPQIAYYNNLKFTGGMPEDCVECGQCEGACPQHLPIIEHLKTVSGYFASK